MRVNCRVLQRLDFINILDFYVGRKEGNVETYDESDVEAKMVLVVVVYRSLGNLR